MAYDKQSFLSMLAAGLVCKGTLAQKEPVIPDEPSGEPGIVGYRYSDSSTYGHDELILPKLPNYDQTAYPYAFIFRNPTYRLDADEKDVNDRWVYLVAHESQHYFRNYKDTTNEGTPRQYYGSENGSPKAIIYRTRQKGNSWDLTEVTDWSLCVELGWLAYEIIWGNFVLYNTSGYALIQNAGYKPIPVYE